MWKQGPTRWTFLLTCAVILQYVASKGTIDLRFIKFVGDGKDANGNCCDAPWPWGCGNACDPFFYVCIDHINGNSNAGDCHYKSQFKTGVIHEQNVIYFSDSIGGTANPIIAHLAGEVPKDILFKFHVVDNDPANSHDTIASISKSVRGLKTSFNGNKGEYASYTAGSTDRAKLTIGVRVFCDKYYYGSSCTKYCKSNEGPGHYTCNTNGDKVCHIGWTGSNCDSDINECMIPNFCHNGATCDNIDGGYNCLCADGFKGVHCKEVNHTCAINPCQNGGSCSGNQTDYTCDCLPWWSGVTCNQSADACDSSPCLNGATCVSNNVTLPGYTCSCKSDWTGEACDVEVTTTTSTTTTTTTTTTTKPTSIKTTTIHFELGDPSYITLLGVIDHTNILELENGLVKLIKELGGVGGEVNVMVKPKVISIKPGVVTTYVEFHATEGNGPVDPGLIENIFNSYDDETINPYLPLPIYRETFDGPQKQVQEAWIEDNWWAAVIPALAFFVILACIIAFIIVSRRKKEKENSFMGSDSNVEQANASNMAFENVLYHETHRNRQSDGVDSGEVTFTPSAREQEVLQGACGENPYAQPVQYDTPMKQPSCAPNGVMHYQNSNLASLDTRCEAGANDYQSFSDLDGAHGQEIDNPYQELDDVLAQKAALAVGFPTEDCDKTPDDDDDDSEDDIDKIKAEIRLGEADA